jgi:hypothetical protein
MSKNLLKIETKIRIPFSPLIATSRKIGGFGLSKLPQSFPSAEIFLICVLQRVRSINHPGQSGARHLYNTYYILVYKNIYGAALAPADAERARGARGY